MFKIAFILSAIIICFNLTLQCEEMKCCDCLSGILEECGCEEEQINDCPEPDDVCLAFAGKSEGEPVYWRACWSKNVCENLKNNTDLEIFYCTSCNTPACNNGELPMVPESTEAPAEK